MVEGQTSEQGSRPEEQKRRSLKTAALGLIVVSALFCGAVAGVMIMTYVHEPGTAPTSAALEELQLSLETGRASQDAALSQRLKELIRQEDLRLRRQYFQNRLLIGVGTFLLAAGLAALVLSARWFASLDVDRPTAPERGGRSDPEGWFAARRRNLVAVATGAAVFIVGLSFVAVLGGSAPDEIPTLAAQAGETTQPAEPEEAQPQVWPRRQAGFEEVWTRFRGPNGLGIVRAGDWPTQWDGGTGRNVAWKSPVPVPGKSSPVVWGNRIFLTGATEEKREVLCYERTTGKLLWRTAVTSPPTAPDPSDVVVMEDTGYAAPSPATNGRHVYATYANSDVAAVDFEGNVVWVKNLGKPENFYGRATSLLVYEDTVIVQFDRGYSPDEGLSELVALECDTGDVAWRTPRPVRASWSTPVVVDTPDGKQLLTCAEPWVIAYDPAMGTDIWRAQELSGDVAPSPTYAEGVAYATNQYAKVMAVRTDGVGDVSESHVAWTASDGMSDTPSPIATSRYFLQVQSSGYMTCYDSRSGQLLWHHQLEGTVWASPGLVGDTVYLPAEDGKTYIFPLADEYRDVSVSALSESVYATPVFCDDRIYMRGDENLYCIVAGGGGEAE